MGERDDAKRAQREARRLAGHPKSVAALVLVVTEAHPELFEADHG